MNMYTAVNLLHQPNANLVRLEKDKFRIVGSSRFGEHLTLVLSVLRCFTWNLLLPQRVSSLLCVVFVIGCTEIIFHWLSLRAYI
jgi:hypothetical protein